MKNRGASGIDTARGDRTFYAIVNAIVGVFMLIVLIPLVNIVASSFSSPGAVSSGKVLFWPVEFSLDGYKTVFQNKMIGTAYFNTFFYTVVGTMINLAMTMMAAYALARKNLPYKGFFMFLFTFTMLFSGGTIPNYMLIVNLKLYDTRWAMLLPGALSVYNMILTRTYILSNVPVELLEASQIDGCSDARYFTAVLLPLCKPIIAVVALYSVVGHWNSYFNAMIYLKDRALYPLQLFLREILVQSKLATLVAEEGADEATLKYIEEQQMIANLLKYCVIVISTAPMMVIYPWMQRFFAKGVMIGSVKG